MILLSILPVHAQDRWIADEIFLQLAEMRKEIAGLKQTLATLKETGGTHGAIDSIPLLATDFRILGRQSAGIVIMEFSDYACPYCIQHFKQTFPKLRERFIDTGVIQYRVKDFPLDSHPQARQAASAAQCAGGQGAYWAMHDALFLARGVYSESLIDTLAKPKHVDAKAFKYCLEHQASSDWLAKDLSLARSLGIDGTPAFVVGKIKQQRLVEYRVLSGVQSFETFVGLIEGLQRQP